MTVVVSFVKKSKWKKVNGVKKSKWGQISTIDK